MMGDDKIKVKFFTTFVSEMRKNNPQFGRGCYVDSTPLPNDITDNPFNALRCHGIASSSMQIRLALVLDEKTGLPVWYDIIPGNILDINTIILLMLRKFTLATGSSVSSIIARTQSLMCCKKHDGYVNIETPSRQCKHYYSVFVINIPSRLKISKFRKEILLFKFKYVVLLLVIIQGLKTGLEKKIVGLLIL